MKIGQYAAYNITIMKSQKNLGSKNEDSKKYLYAQPKFMIPPDPLKLPEPFKNSLLKKEETEKKKE